MPTRPLVWLTVFFMLGISADRLFPGGLPVLTGYFALAALVLISAMASAMWLRSRNGGRKTEGGGREAEDGPSRPFTHSARIELVSGANSIRRFTNFALPALLFAIFGMWASKAAAPRFPRTLQPFLDGRSASYMAEVSGSPRYYPDKIRIPLHLLLAMTGDRETPLGGGMLLSIPRENPAGSGVFFLPGDRVLFRAVLKRFHGFRNPGGFDYARYEAGKGFYARCFLKKDRMLIKIAPASGLSPGSILNAIRGRIDLFRQKTLLWVQRSLDPAPAALYAAMILGYKYLLDAKWQDRIHQTGLNHLLSVSGLHIGMVCMFVFWLVRIAVRFLFPSVLNRVSDQQIALWPALAAAVFYAFLAGFGTPSIWRSILTLAVFFGAAFLYRAVDPLSVLALAALFILVPDPGSLSRIPFQFTFTCVLAIIVIYPRFRRIRLSAIFPALRPGSVQGRIISLFEDAFWISIAVNILLLPLIIYYFDGFSLAGIVANVFLLPYVGFVVLPLGLLSVFLFAFSETQAYPVVYIVNHLLWGCLHIIKWFAGLSWSYFWTGSFSPAWLLVVYGSLGLLFASFSRKLKIAGLSAVALFVCFGLALNSLAESSNTGTLRVDVIDVGQGSSTLVRLPTGETMLVDGGGIPGDSYDIGREVLAPFLWREGVRRIDYVALSHYHPDHALGLCFILRNFDVGSFWTSEMAGDDHEARVIRRRLNEIALKRKIRIRTFPDLFKDVQIGRARIRLLHPAGDFFKHASEMDLNDLSLVFEISFGKTRVILPGDIDRSVEESIIPALEGGMQTLLVGAHHGSRHSNSEEFLDALRPAAVVFSCGYDNPFHFPAAAVLERCAERHSPVYRTDLDGDVHAVSDGRKWTITTEADRDIDSKGRGKTENITN